MILASMLMIGLFCNLLIRPVADHWFMRDEEREDENSIAGGTADNMTATDGKVTESSSFLIVIFAWMAVLFPLGWGLYKTSLNVSKFFS